MTTPLANALRVANTVLGIRSRAGRLRFPMTTHLLRWLYTTWLLGKSVWHLHQRPRSCRPVLWPRGRCTGRTPIPDISKHSARDSAVPVMGLSHSSHRRNRPPSTIIHSEDPDLRLAIAILVPVLRSLIDQVLTVWRP